MLWRVIGLVIMPLSGSVHCKSGRSRLLPRLGSTRGKASCVLPTADEEGTHHVRVTRFFSFFPSLSVLLRVAFSVLTLDEEVNP